MRAVVDNSILFISVKAIGLTAVIFLVNNLTNKKLCYFALSGAIGITLVVVINNLLLIV